MENGILITRTMTRWMGKEAPRCDVRIPRQYDGPYIGDTRYFICDFDHHLHVGEFTEREHQVMRMRYAKGMTQKTIAKNLRICRERVRQIQARAENKISKMFTKIRIYELNRYGYNEI